VCDADEDKKSAAEEISPEAAPAVQTANEPDQAKMSDQELIQFLRGRLSAETARADALEAERGPGAFRNALKRSLPALVPATAPPAKKKRVLVEITNEMPEAATVADIAAAAAQKEAAAAQKKVRKRATPAKRKPKAVASTSSMVSTLQQRAALAFPPLPLPLSIGANPMQQAQSQTWMGYNGAQSMQWNPSQPVVVTTTDELSQVQAMQPRFAYAGDQRFSPVTSLGCPNGLPFQITPISQLPPGIVYNSR